MRNYATMQSAILAVLEAELNCNRSGESMLQEKRGNLSVNLIKSHEAEYPDTIEIKIQTKNMNHPFFNPISFVHGPLTQIIDGDILDFSFNYSFQGQDDEPFDIFEYWTLTVTFD